ncbi:MAG: FAD:protein FMN transferase [Ruminococcus sp.]|nr:FAD:protein FMN transferase [Ruminococcus sp.]
MLLCLFIAVGCERNINTVKSEFLLDTYVTITMSGKFNEDGLFDALREVSAAADECYSKPFSEINNPLLSDMSHKGENLREIYGDELDFSIGALTKLWGISKGTQALPSPEEINNALKDKRYFDPGAIAKGYALDKAYSYLSESDATGYSVISAESSILLYGKKPDGENFLTAIKDPLIPGSYIGFIETEAAFISTSGNSERYSEIDGKRYGHIFDTKTGYPIETDFASVTVIVPAFTPDGGIMSDFLSTLIFMNGTAGLDTFSEYEGFTFIAVDKAGKVYGNEELFPIE